MNLIVFQSELRATPSPAVLARLPWLCRVAVLVIVAWSPGLVRAAKYTGEAEIQATPLTPEQALSRFRLEPGLRIELVAAEPLITDPVEIAFDEAGRMFVAETVGYNRAPGVTPRSRIRVLEDVDGDGRMDRGSTFADDLDYAQGVLPAMGGIVVTTNSQVLLLRDRDGDGKADAQEVLFQGPKSLYVDHQMASPRRGIDNWIYINNGLGGKELHRPSAPDRKLNLGNYNFRFHPVTGAFELASARGQFGKTFDDWGHEFVSVNRNPAMFAVLPYRFLTRNPQAFLTEADEDVAPSGGAGKVYPLKRFRTTSGAHAGTYTAACGISAYRGDLLPPEYRGNLFVCEPTGELVSRWVPETSGASFSARRPQPGREFLASDDEWFRPVNTTTGPDGALYVVDMYRRFIDGARFFPDDYVATNDMGAGTSRGRIYRIVPAAGPASRAVTALPREPLQRVALLEHPNGWHRDTAQRLLVEAGDAGVASAVETLLRTSRSAPGRLHALWTLEGLNCLEPAHVRAALDDAEPGVVENALWLAARFQAGDDTLRRRVIALAAHDNPRLRFVALLVAGELSGPDVSQALVRAALRDVDNNWIRTAVLSSPATQGGEILAALLQDPAFRSSGTPGRIDLVRRLAAILAGNGGADELKPVLMTLSAGTEAAAGHWADTAVVSGVADGLRRQTKKTLPSSVSALLAAPPGELADALNGVRRIVGAAPQVLRERDRPLSQRLAAIPMLEHLPKEEATALIGPLLNRREPVEIQKAMIAAIAHMSRPVVTPILYENLAEMGTAARSGAIEFLQRNPLELLKKIKAGVINPALVDASTRWVLLNSKSDEIRALGQEVFGSVEGDRKRLVARYASAVSRLEGTRERGKAVFLQTCAMCHRFGPDGSDVGPDISDVRIKSVEMLLSDILDPNGAVEPRWETYLAKTQGGRDYMGLVASETSDAIVMKGIGWQESLPRGSVEDFTPLGTSLMPQGLEGALNHQQMSDLLAFLQSRADGTD